jgi:hypothetical protein
MDEMEYFLQPYDFLFIALEEFQRRNLKMDNDALNAMAGFIQRVSESGKTEMVEGVPVKLLPMALLFRNRVENPRYSRDVQRRSDFPSWSWAGWRASSFWDAWKDIDITEGEDQILDWLTDGNWISWATVKQHGSMTTVHDPGSIRQILTADLPDREGILHEEKTLQPIFREESVSQNPVVPSRFRPETSAAPSSASKPPILSDAPYTLLVFRTLSITLVLGNVIKNSYCRFELLDASGSMCGEIIPDFIPADSATTDQNQPGSSATREFLVLSERHDWPNRLVAPGDEGYDQGLADVVVQDTYWIMMVEFLEGTGAHERRGIGFVDMKTVDKIGGVWKEITLG